MRSAALRRVRPSGCAGWPMSAKRLKRTASPGPHGSTAAASDSRWWSATAAPSSIPAYCAHSDSSSPRLRRGRRLGHRLFLFRCAPFTRLGLRRALGCFGHRILRMRFSRQRLLRLDLPRERCRGLVGCTHRLRFGAPVALLGGEASLFSEPLDLLLGKPRLLGCASACFLG